MDVYRLFETSSFRKDLEKYLPPEKQKTLLKKLGQLVYSQLREQPHFGSHIKKLKNYEPESWRYRVGDLRLFYSIDETNKVVILTALRWRKDAY